MEVQQCDLDLHPKHRADWRDLLQHQRFYEMYFVQKLSPLVELTWCHSSNPTNPVKIIWCHTFSIFWFIVEWPKHNTKAKANNELETYSGRIYQSGNADSLSWVNRLVCAIIRLQIIRWLYMLQLHRKHLIGAVFCSMLYIFWFYLNYVGSALFVLWLLWDCLNRWGLQL